MSAIPPITLDPASPLPLRAQLRRHLAAAIRSGQIPAGATLPTVLELAEELGIGAGTVRDAVLELGAAGLVHGNGRAGTKVQSVALLHQRLLAAGAELAQIAHQVGATMEDAEAAILASWSRTALDAPEPTEPAITAEAPVAVPVIGLPAVAVSEPDEGPARRNRHPTRGRRSTTRTTSKSTRGGSVTTATPERGVACRRAFSRIPPGVYTWRHSTEGEPSVCAEQ